MDIFTQIQNFINEAYKNGDKPLVVVLGPTASGKTALSLDLAKKFDGEIVSADSRQIYKFMDIGTDKIMPKDQKGIPHHMIDLILPDERFTLTDYKTQASIAINDILKRGKIPLLVGGTGLYIRSITQNYDIPEGENPEIRQKLYEELEKKGEDFMHEKLKKLDPLSAEKIHPHNHRYLIRALEINMTHGKKIDKKRKPEFKYMQIGIEWEREKLYERIGKRVDLQIERGLIKEVEKLLEMGYSPKLPSMTSLGYQEIIQFLEKKITLEEATELIKRNTRNYSKRQLTWFRRDENIDWLPNEIIF